MRPLVRDPLADPEPLIRRVYAYVAYRIGDGPDAEDVTGEVFERALRYRDTYQPAKGQPIAWLIGIARRCIAESLAARPPVPTERAEELADDDFQERSVQRLTLAAAVDGLDERSRELIALRYGADLTARQIAALLGMHTNGVEVALHRALARLRNALESDQPGEPSTAAVDELAMP